MFIRSFVRGFNTASGVSIIGHRVAQSGRDESKARVVRMYNFTEVAKDRADRILFRDSQDGRVKFFTNRCDFGGVNFDCFEILSANQQITLRGRKRLGGGRFGRFKHFFCRLGITGSTVVIFTLGRGGARARRSRGKVPKVRESVGGESRIVFNVTSRIFSQDI